MKELNKIQQGSYVNHVDVLINDGRKFKVLRMIDEQNALFYYRGQFFKERVEKLIFNGNEPQFSF